MIRVDRTKHTTICNAPLSHCWQSGEPRMLHAGYLYVCVCIYIYIYISKRNRVGDTVANYNLNKLLLTTPEIN